MVVKGWTRIITVTEGHDHIKPTTGFTGIYYSTASKYPVLGFRTSVRILGIISEIRIGSVRSKMIKTKKMAITFLLVAVNVAVLYGIYAFAVTPEPFNPVPQSHEWARDKALEYLDIADPGRWSVTDPNNGLIGATTKIYASGSLSVTVSHNLNPSAAFMVTVEQGNAAISLWVQQDGTVQTIN
jgi:hypothetical protein